MHKQENQVGFFTQKHTALRQQCSQSIVHLIMAFVCKTHRARVLCDPLSRQFGSHGLGHRQESGQVVRVGRIVPQ